MTSKSDREARENRDLVETMLPDIEDVVVAGTCVLNDWQAKFVARLRKQLSTRKAFTDKQVAALQRIHLMV